MCTPVCVSHCIVAPEFKGQTRTALVTSQQTMYSVCTHVCVCIYVYVCASLQLTILFPDEWIKEHYGGGMMAKADGFKFWKER